MLNTLRTASPEALTAIAEEMQVRRTNEVFLLFAMGSQFDHLIKQHLERLGVFCLVADPKSVSAGDVAKVNPKGIIISGGPASVVNEPPPFDEEIFSLKYPILGICLGFQMWAKYCGATVIDPSKREFGVLTFKQEELGDWEPINTLFEGLPRQFRVLQSHGDYVCNPAELFVLGGTDNTPVAAAMFDHLWGVQFHPEVTETEYGEQIFSNFCFRICVAKDQFPAEDLAERKVIELRAQLGGHRVLLALSGGSDSSTVAYLLRNAVREAPGQIRGVYIKGIDRPDDEQHVRQCFGHQPWLDLRIVDAEEEFLAAAAGRHTAEKKRAVMRPVYRRVLEQEAREFTAAFIAQGTLYTDISESGGGYSSSARKAQIKQHHNVNLGFSIPELIPLSDCVKDGGRNIGRSIGVPEELLIRHPFPGPGMLIRVEGEVTRERLHIIHEADRIFIEELHRWELYHTVWQAGATLTCSTHTYTKGDDAGVGMVIRLWAVWSVNGFTARRARLPDDFLDHVSQRITNEIREVASVDYRISGKPPATIECG